MKRLLTPTAAVELLVLVGTATGAAVSPVCPVVTEQS